MSGFELMGWARCFFVHVILSMGVDLLSKLRGSISLPSHPSPSLPSPFPPLQSFPFRKHILGAFRAQNGVWWQQCDMSHNHSLIINIHYFWWMQCIWMQSLNGWWTKMTCTVALAKVEAQFPLTNWQRSCSLCFITCFRHFAMVQTMVDPC